MEHDTGTLKIIKFCSFELLFCLPSLFDKTLLARVQVSVFFFQTLASMYMSKETGMSTHVTDSNLRECLWYIISAFMNSKFAIEV